MSVIVKQNVDFEALLTSNKVMDRRLKEVTKQVLRKARTQLSRDARSGLQMKSDPRAAYRAVKTAVYKRVYGGSVSILARRKAGVSRSPLPPATPGRPRSTRTEQLLSYYGADRGFILRFLNQGTTSRYVKGMNGRKRFAGAADRNGHRGSITARNWFGRASLAQLQSAAAEIDKLIDQVIQENKL